MRKVAVPAVVGLLFLSACNGSGSNPNPAPTQPVTTLTVGAQRNSAQAGLVAEQTIILLQAVSGPLITALDGGTGDGSCSNGVEETVVYPSPLHATVTVDVFFEPTCVNLWQHLVVDAAVSLPSTVNGTGAQTVYTPQHAVVAYNTFSATFTGGSTESLEAQGSLAAAKGAPALGSFGLSCTGSSSSEACGYGAILNLPPLGTEIGSSFNMTGTQSATALNGNLSLTASTGALDSMTLSKGAGTAWNVTGGTAFANTSGTYAGTLDAEELIQGLHVTLSDNSADARSDLDLASSATTGTVTQISNGAKAATLSTDVGGNGKITYSTGATATISSFFISP